MYERFTQRARQVVVLAQEEARGLHHEHVGSEHILLGLLREGEGVGCQVLESLDVTAERVRGEVFQLFGVGEKSPSGQIPFTPRVRRVYELALKEAALTPSFNQGYVSTEHILLGLIRDNEGVAVRILHDFDADPDKIRDEVIWQMANSAVGSKPSAGSAPKIGDSIDALEIQISRLFSSSGGDMNKIGSALQCLHDCRDLLASADLL